MGKGTQITILIALIVVAWTIINSPSNTTYFSITLNFVPVIIGASIFITLLASLSILALGLTELMEIMNATDQIKIKVEKSYNFLYFGTIVVSVGGIAIQSLTYFIDYVSTFLTKISKAWWQAIILFVITTIALKFSDKWGKNKDGKV